MIARSIRCAFRPACGKSDRMNSRCAMNLNTRASIKGRSGSIASQTSELRPCLSLWRNPIGRAKPARQSSRQPPRFDHIGVVEHGVDRMRGVLRAEKFPRTRAPSSTSRSTSTRRRAPPDSIPPPLIRTPADETLREIPTDMYCKTAQNDPSAVRGARNYPCQNSRQAGPDRCALP